MKDGLRFVDSDMHVMEPPDLFERYLDPKFRDRVTVRIGADGRPNRGPAGTILIDGEPTSDQDFQQYRKRKTAAPTHVISPLSGSRLQETDRLDFDAELVSRDDVLPEAHAVEGEEHRDARLLVGLAHEKRARELRHRLDLQDARHDRLAREVALEEGLVDRDVLDAHRPLVSVHLDDAVDEQHRVAVGEDLGDFADVEERRVALRPRRARRGARLLDPAHEPRVRAVARTDGDHFRPQRSAQQREVADQVENLVAHVLVRPPQPVVDGPVGSDDERVAGRPAASQPLLLQGFGFALEAERARGGDLARERFLVDRERELLGADGRPGIVERVRDVQARLVGKSDEVRVLVGDRDRLDRKSVV